MKKIILTIVLFSFVFAGCNDFLEIVPEDRATADNFYASVEQLDAGTAHLYNRAWFIFFEKAAWLIGDAMAGNSLGQSGEWKVFETFSVTNNNEHVISTWAGLFTAVSHANFIINELPGKASGPGITPEVVNSYVGEARFIRALAYFYLVRLFGPVPIIENSADLVQTPMRNLNITEDVYKFIIADLKYAEENCAVSLTKERAGRVTQMTAKALLSSVYLAIKDYDNAKIKAKEVIDSKTYQLLPSYADLFKITYNNNVESVFALQWKANSAWGSANVHQAYFAVYGAGLTGFTDGWATVVPSIFLRDSYENGDLRRNSTIMVQNNFYPELLQSKGGYTYTKASGSQSKCNVKKYVVGTPGDNNGEVGFMSTSMNTYIIRYPEVLLNYAEAILGANNSTSDPEALWAVNQIRTRAGLPEFSDELTFAQVFKERHIEFALEFKYWYDLCRIDRAKAIQIISNQERGTEWGVLDSKKYTPMESDFLLPIPSSEIDKAPVLTEAPVPYY